MTRRLAPLALVAFALAMTPARAAHAELHELAQRVADAYKNAGGRVVILPARFLYDDGTVFEAAGGDGDLSIMLRNWAVTSDMHVDWVRARPIVAPEPTLTAGAEESM